MTTPAELLAAIQRPDPTRPRLTWYDDADGPTRGERIELSGRVLANWVAKTANLLAGELGVERGDVVVVDLPPHWRGLYWALAAWRAGAVVSVQPDERALVVVTDRPADVSAPAGARVVAVSLPALARRWAGAPLEDALDEAAEVLGQPDVFEPFDEPDDDDPALASGGEELTAAELGERAAVRAGRAGWTPGERVGLTADAGHAPGGAAALLVDVLAVWAADGSVVLVRDADTDALAARWAAERVTSACAPGGTPASPR